MSGPLSGSASEAGTGRPTLQVVGAGLLGTSVGLALAGGEWRVWISDRQQRAAEVAADLGAGMAGWCPQEPDLVLLAVPPGATGEVMEDINRRYVNATVSDVCSVKTHPQQEAERIGLGTRFVGGHPMAGRERSGATAARSDLFDARVWAVCPGPAVERSRVALVERLIVDCGADPVLLSVEQHDAAVGLVSHLPQLVASALASQLRGSDDEALNLAGQGLRDTVRIAGSDPLLWADILASNAVMVAPLVQRLASELTATGESLRRHAGGKSTKREIEESLQRLLLAGQQGYGLIPGKHGTAPVEYAVVPVVVPDEPGALARLFTAVDEAGASVEDIRLEHSAGHPVGLVELSVRPAQAGPLTEALRAAGWSAH